MQIVFNSPSSGFLRHPYCIQSYSWEGRKQGCPSPTRTISQIGEVNTCSEKEEWYWQCLPKLLRREKEHCVWQLMIAFVEDGRTERGLENQWEFLSSRLNKWQHHSSGCSVQSPRNDTRFHFPTSLNPDSQPSLHLLPP